MVKSEIKSKKKIAFLVYSMGGGGTERVISTLLPKLNNYFEVHLVLFNNPIIYPIPKNQIVTCLRKESRVRLWRLLTIPIVAIKFLRYCQKEKIQKTLSFGTLANFVNCAIKILGWKGETIISERNHSSELYKKSNLRNFIINYLIKCLYSIADKIIALSKGVKKDLKEFYRIKIPIVIIYNPVEIDKINAIKGKQIKKNKAKFIFIHIGSFFPVKNHFLLLEAFKVLKIENCELWLLGEGSLKQTIKEKTIAFGIDKKVKFLGFQPNPFLYLAQADCLISSSNTEGFGNVITEALASGKSVIATDCPSGPREILAPNTDYCSRLKERIEIVEYGILTPVKDVTLLAKSMKLIFENKALKHKFDRKARIRARKFDIKKIANQYRKILE